MATVHDVAAYIVDELGPVTPMKLQKLLYYCQAWHLVCEGGRLFDDRVEAWDHGPVVLSVWTVTAGSRDRVRVWPLGSAAAVTGKAEEVVKAVLAQYGSLTAAQLRNLTHSETPWASARARSRQIITDAEMTEYYAEQLDTSMDLRLAEKAERVVGEMATLDEVAAELGWW